MNPADREIEDKWVIDGDDVFNKKMYDQEEALIKSTKMDALPPTQRLKIRVGVVIRNFVQWSILSGFKI